MTDTYQTDRSVNFVAAPIEDVQVHQRLTWLLFFRTFVMAVLLIVTVLINIGDTEVLSQPPYMLLYAAVGFSFVIILIGALWQHHHAKKWLSGQIYLQIASDVVGSTMLVMATGGADSAFLFLYSLNAINSAALRYQRGAFVTAILAASSFALVLAASVLFPGIQEIGPHPLTLRQAINSFIFNASAIMLIAGLASYVSGQLRQAGESLQETRGDLNRLEALHAAVVQSLTSGLMATNEEGNITLLNPTGERLLRASSSTTLGRKAYELIPDLHDKIGAEVGRRFETNLNVDGDERFFGVSVAPLLDSLRGLRGSVVTFQDLTEVHQLELAMQRSERLAMVGRFAAGLAHELRNPLGSMTGCVELLKATVVDQIGTDDANSTKRLFDIVLTETERLNKLVSDFLVYARPSPPQFHRLDVVELVEETLAVVQRENGALSSPRFESTIPRHPVFVSADIGQLKQLLWNLFRNATQAAGNDGIVSVRVDCEVERSGREVVRLRVEDNGVGIEKGLRSKIFEPFFTTKTGGTGLGLPTVLRIVEEHDGNIHVEQSELGGAVFHVVLPTFRVLS